MNSLLDKALAALARGWYVFPCSGKIPIEEGGFKTASNNETKIREWWKAYPKANPGVWPGGSLFTSVDIDTGLTNEASLRDFCARYGLPETFALRTGKRPQFRVQLLFSGNTESFNRWQVDEFAGDVRGSWGHVMAPGSIHPESGAPYEILWDKPLAPLPEWARSLQPVRKQREIDPTAPIVEWRNDTLYRVLCKHRGNGADDEMVRQFAYRAVAQMPNPLDDEEVERVITNALKQPIGVPDAVAVVGSKLEETKVTDWRDHYHTLEALENAPPASFLIDGFLQMDGITALAAPVGQRKSLIALNVAWALCTGSPLFGHFKVSKQPERVLYLCPEMGIRSFTDRLRRIGLMQYVGKTLFCRTMSAESALELDDMTPEELSGSVVIIDTAVRYLKGDENSSEDMRKFAESIFRIMKSGAISVLLLHHSAKGTKESNELTLENSMRGSGELGAFVTSCWATRLQDPGEPYQSASFIANVKQRDFESKPFEVTSGKDCRLHIVADPEHAVAVLNSKQRGPKSNLDGRDAEALALLKENPKLSLRLTAALLKEHGIKRGKDWVQQKRASGLSGVSIDKE